MLELFEFAFVYFILYFFKMFDDLFYRQDETFIVNLQIKYHQMVNYLMKPFEKYSFFFQN
jgi:hypothetical protein